MPRYASIFHLVSLCFLGLLSSSVFALGLGEITLKSHLNQPLVAEIELLQVRELTLSEILPSLASRKDFDAAGVERSFLLGLMNFQVKLGENGRNIILVTTAKPIREPFLNFLVEVIWPSGRLLREYTLLLDPPVFAEGVTKASALAQKPVTKKSTQSGVTRAPNPTAKPSLAAGSSSSNLAKSATSSSYMQSGGVPKPASRPQNKRVERVSEKPTSVGARDTANRSAGDSGQYRIEKGDTLQSIANVMRDGRSANINQVMVAIQRENPSAFIDGNINLLKQGTVIRKPSPDAVASIDKRTAIQEVERQSKLWKNRLGGRRQGEGLNARVLNATGEDTTPDAPAKKEQDGGHLNLLSGDGRKTKSGSGGSASTGGDSALLAEELDKTKISNSDLRERVTSLSQQVDDSKKLIELKSQQFAELKARLAEIEAENARLKAKLNMPVDAVATSKSPVVPESTPSPAIVDEVAAPVEQTPAPVIPDESSVMPSAAMEDMTMSGTVTDTPVDGALPADGQTVLPPNQAEDLNFNQSEPADASEPSAEPVVESVVSTPEPVAHSWMQDVLNKPFYWMIIGGGLIVLLAAFLLWRRSHQEQFFDEDEDEDEDDVEQDSKNNLTDLDPMSSNAQTVISNESKIINKSPAAQTAVAAKAKASNKPQQNSIDSDDTQVMTDVDYDLDSLPDPFAGTDTTEEAADILGEADIYIAYGRFDQAEDVLIKAIKRDKTHPEFYLKLIEVYAEKNDTTGFDRTVKQLNSQGFSANFSHRITELRSTLSNAAANINTKEEVLDTLPELLEDEKGPLESVSNLDFDDEDSLLKPNKTNNNASDALSTLDDLESNIIGTMPESDEATSDSSLMDFDADEPETIKFALDDSFDTLQPKPLYERNHNDDIISPKLQHDGLGDSDLLANSLDDQSYDLDMESLAADLDADLNQMSSDRASINVADISEATADEVIGDEDEVATKLDLARAYMDMGDREGAKDILDEVVRDGTPKQKQEAQSLLKKIS